MAERVEDRLFEVALEQYGYVTTADAVAVGVDPTQLRILSRRGRVEHVDHGLYRMPLAPATELDVYMEAVLRTGGVGVLSHATALDLHGLCDVNPAALDITVPTSYRPRRTFPDMLRFHRRDLDSGAVTFHKGIPIVTPYRAIVDGIEAQIGGHLVRQAVETALSAGLPVRERVLLEELLGLEAQTAG